MVASRQKDIRFYRGIGRQRGWGFDALAQVIERTAIPFLRIYIVPAAKLVGAHLMEFALSEFADVVIGRIKLKTAAKSVGRKTLRERMGRGNRKRNASGNIPTKSAKQNRRSRKNIFKNISH